ncbi:MAG: AAA family ATPase [Candidatus Aenigmarchaeota archaeon]|nr:AAA family ATPase [Candidatus Aenigmarchaeota archaeon]
MEENKIIKDLRVLSVDFPPSRIVQRDGQLKALRDNLNFILEKKPPRNSFLYGPPGTGKTCISQYVVDELRKHAAVNKAYVNCWEYPSKFKILFSVLQSIGETFSIHRKGTPTDELLDILKKRAAEKHVIVILDEVDRLESLEILYDFLLAGVFLILISNQETAFHEADPRIRSRLSSLDHISFPPYSIQDVKDILTDRRDCGLIPGSVKGTQLERIAEKASGDARVAINILRMAAEEAENQDLEKIPDSFIEKAFPRAEKIPMEDLMAKLSPHQKVALEVICKKKKIASIPLYHEFGNALRQKGLSPIVDRTFRKHLDRLLRFGLVKSEGEGRWKVYYPTQKTP